MNLTPVTGTARGAAARPPQGAGAAPDDESFLAALGALSSLVATIDGEPAEASTADDAVSAAEGASGAENGITALPIDATLAWMSASQTGIVAVPAAQPAAPAGVAIPLPGGDQIPGAVGAGASPLALEAGGQAVAPAGDAQAEAFEATEQGAETALSEFEKSRASLLAMERLRMSGTPAENTERSEETAPQATRMSAVLTRVGAQETQPTPSPTLTQHVASAFAQGVSTAPGRGSDAGDTGPGSAFGGHTGSHTSPGVIHTPSLTPGFATLVSSLQAAEPLPPETTTQIVQAIRMQIMRDGGEAHIRLDPRQFGDMTVRIRVDQGQVTARVEADAPVVREWIQGNQHLLRQNLAGQHLTLDRLEVHEPPAPSDHQHRDGQSARDQDGPRHRGARRRRPDTGELFEVVA